MNQNKDPAFGLSFKWRSVKREDLQKATDLLVDNERKYVGACGRFLARAEGDHLWVLSGKNGEVAALAVNSRSTLIPVLSANNNTIWPDFPVNFLRSKSIHSLQGLTNEVVHFEKSMAKAGRRITDQYEYDLMSIDTYPEIRNKKSCPVNLVLRVPTLADLNSITPLQAAYEMEEVIPAGSSFNPAASRIATAKMIAGGKIFAAEINGRFIGKIHVNAVSFTRYQVGGVYVHPEFRGMGIAGKMTAEFITLLLSECRGITLFVKKNNAPARRLYAGLGFSVKGDYRITYY